MRRPLLIVPKLILSRDLADQIDQRRQEEPDQPSLPEALLRLVEIGLDRVPGGEPLQAQREPCGRGGR
jgi:hypothetical protein